MCETGRPVEPCLTRCALPEETGASGAAEQTVKQICDRVVDRFAEGNRIRPGRVPGFGRSGPDVTGGSLAVADQCAGSTRWRVNWKPRD